MTGKQEVLKKIKEYFNLNIYETKVWHALLSKGVATAGEIAQISEVPRSRTYDVLESLEKQGFAVEKLGKPVKYIAVNPSMVLERLKSNILREADERSKMLAEIKTSDDYKQIELLHKQGITPTHSVEISGMIKGRNNIYNHLKDMISNAKKEVIISTNSDELVKKKLMKHLSNSLKRKDISVKIAVSGDITDEIKELNAEIKIQGNFSKAWPQKGFSVKAKDDYDGYPIDYQLFPDKPVTEFKSFNIRNAGSDWNTCHMRDRLNQKTVS